PQRKKASDDSNPYRETFVDIGVVARCIYSHGHSILRTHIGCGVATRGVQHYIGRSTEGGDCRRGCATRTADRLCRPGVAAIRERNERSNAAHRACTVGKAWHCPAQWSTEAR